MQLLLKLMLLVLIDIASSTIHVWIQVHISIQTALLANDTKTM